jgi:hypothetical protein
MTFSFSQATARLTKGAADNSPAILTAVGVSGTIAVAVLSARASAQAVRCLSGEDVDPWLSWQEKAKMVWKFYVPPAIVGTVTVAAIVGSNRVSTSRAAALATAYTISEQTFDTYKRKVIEKLGEDGEHEVRAAVAQERVNLNDSPVLVIGAGKVLCYDEFTDRYFESTVEDIKKAQNDTNYQMLHEGYASLSDFYARVGLPTTSMSEEVGWTSDKQLEVEITSVVSPDQRPAIAVGFRVRPVRDYWKFNR